MQFIYNRQCKKVLLCGNEIQIRSLIRYMLYECYYEKMYEDKEYCLFLNTYEKLLNNLELSISSSLKDTLAGALYVSVKRFNQEFRTPIEITHEDTKIYNYIEKIKDIHNLFYFNFQILLSIDILSDICDGKITNLKKVLCTEDTKKKKELRNTIRTLFEYYALKKTKKHVLIHNNELNILMRIINFNSNIVSFMYNPYLIYWDFETNQEEKKIYLKLIHQFSLNKHLSNIQKKQEFFYHMNKILQSKGTFSTFQKKNVLIISAYPEFYKESIFYKLNTKYANHLHLKLYDKSIYSITKNDLKKYDIILSELNINIFEEKCIFLPETITSTLLEKLEKALFI